MAEVIGTVSAITTCVTVAFETTVRLYQTVKSFKSRDKLIRDLRVELQDLRDVLKTLQQLIDSLDVDLTAFEGPLKRCASACTDFNTLIVECTQNSSEERWSKRDWLKIKYMDKDISGFKTMLAGYKSTITIALAYANLRTTKITESVFEEYKELIKNTQCDLENHLQDIRTDLENLLSLNSSAITQIDAVALQRMEEEKQSTQKSLDICEHFLNLMDQSLSSLLGDLESTYLQSSSKRPMESSLINAEGLSSAQKECMSWKIRLLQHLYKVDKQFPTTRFDIPLLRDEPSGEQQIFQEDIKGTEALLEFCKQVEKDANKPRTHHYEDVTAGDDSKLAVVTTLKDLISAKRIKSGNKSTLVLGQMSDATIQKVFGNE